MHLPTPAWPGLTMTWTPSPQAPPSLHRLQHACAVLDVSASGGQVVAHMLISWHIFGLTRPSVLQAPKPSSYTPCTSVSSCALHQLLNPPCSALVDSCPRAGLKLRGVVACPASVVVAVRLDLLATHRWHPNYAYHPQGGYFSSSSPSPDTLAGPREMLRKLGHLNRKQVGSFNCLRSTELRQKLRELMLPGLQASAWAAADL